jgi:hypothetical protein
MSIVYHYATVLKAIEELREKGFTEDFNLEDNYLTGHVGKFSDEEFDIVHVYFYEGATNPDDEATVYGIESASGHKGVLVTGNDTLTDNATGKIVKKLLEHSKENR